MKGYLCKLLFLTVYAGLLPCFVAAQAGITHDGTWIPEYVLVATAQNISINCESRYSIVFNGTSPGPPLYMEEGKTTWVRVYNRIPDENITVHWHGLSQRTAPFSDGTPLVSQWAIGPNNFFDYEIRPEANDSGTYMYHSHVGFQAITAHGLLIVNEANNTKPPYEYHDDIPVVFADYYRRLDDDIEHGLVANPFQWSGEPIALELNGRTGNASLSNVTGDSCKPAVLTVEPGKTYRLRFLGATALSFVMVGIEGHPDLSIIEADGHYTKPASTDHVQLGSGQRYSALLKTKTSQQLQAEGRTFYWIRYENRDRPSNISGYALLQYKWANTTSKMSFNGQNLPASLPATSPVNLTRNVSEYTSWMEYTLESLEEDESKFPAATEVTRTVYVQVNQRVVNGFYNGTVVGGLEWDTNNLTWNEETLGAQHFAPYLIDAYKTKRVPDYDAAIQNGGWDPTTRAFPALVGETLDIVWISNSGPTGGFDSHPMHAHGEHYWDLGSGNGTYDAAANNAKIEKQGHTPVRRDTTQLYRYVTSGSKSYTMGWRAWRIRITEDNVGAWMMHCHILGHMTMGMQTVWVFGNSSDILKKTSQPYMAGYLDYGGSAYGNDTYDPLVVPFFPV